MRSISFLNEFAFETRKGSQVLIYMFKCIGNILIMSKGRDKILGLIQQYCDLYKLCMIEYTTAYRMREWPESVHNAHSLYGSIKNARKFIRLLKWVEEIGLLQEKLQRKLNVALGLKVIRHCFGILYFFIDNFIWFVHMGIIDEGNWHHTIENVKDFISLVRYLFRIIIFLYTSHEKANEEDSLSCKLFNKRTTIKYNTYEHSTLSKIIKTRQKRRYHSIEMTINILRILMLLKSLKLPGTSLMSSIFKSICGIVSATFSLFKLLTRS